jgi:1-deoxy-D-xylulose-5-phosphate synthase
VTFAAGMAVEGYVPVAAIYSTFLQRAIDQVIHDVATQSLHVVFAIDRGGLVGADGPTHHGAYDLSYLRMVPGMVIMAPADEQELRDMLYTAVEYRKGPIALRYPRGNASGQPMREGFQSLDIGKGVILREGEDVAILAIGNMVQNAMKAAELLENSGVRAAVVNMRFVKPLDTALLDDLFARYRNILTVEDNAILGGFGSAVAEYLAATRVQGLSLKLHGIPDEFIEHGTQEELHRSINLDPLGIARTAGALCGIEFSSPLEKHV